MALRDELQGLDNTRMQAALDGAFDKCTSFEETGVMVDQLADGFPALSALLRRLQLRAVEEVAEERAIAHLLFGAALAFLGLVEYANAEHLRLRFPDAPEPSPS